jgi:hypothetical protein
VNLRSGRPTWRHPSENPRENENGRSWSFLQMKTGD